MTTPAAAPRAIHHRRTWIRKLLTFWTLIALVSAVAIAAFADIGEDVAEQSTTVFDEAVRAWMIGHRSPALYEIAYFITWAGSPLVMLLIAIAAGFWFYRRHGHRKAGVLVAAPAIGALVSGSVKHLYARERPPGGLLLNMRTYSFPSGHALTAAAVMVTLCYVMARERIISWPVAAVIGALVPLLVGFTRLYLDVHWTTDVVGGWTAGLFIACISAAMYEYLRRDAPTVAEDLTAEMAEDRGP
ncbi:MAG TPA: phosphatase PAP2 family protein [Gemmatimonadaceae bacterium]|nr:phosphatase PAP2 family protein [Gemmatimonadaceae bacterium]